MAVPLPGAAAKPLAGIKHVLLVSIDGLRPDLLLRADTSVIRGLIDHGTYSLWAMTTPAAITLPSHTSMLTGVPISKHGVKWNTDLPLIRLVWPAKPTLFERAKSAGFTTAMVAGKSKFATLAKPGTLDWSFLPKESVTTDSVVTEAAVDIIRQHAPQVLFVHLPEVDTVGHASGWGSPQQIDAIRRADRDVGRLLEAIRAGGQLDSTLVLVTSDHGGAGKTHGPDDARSRHIPWIVAGPGIRAGHDLTMDASLVVHTEDTFATICWILGIDPGDVDGRPIREIAAVDSAR